MSDVIADSGILIASVYPENLSEKAKGLLKQLQNAGDVLHAPSLLRYEVVSVSRKAAYQGRIKPEEGKRGRDQLLSYPVNLHFDEALLRRGYELAELYNLPTAYDAQYLALAEHLSCAFWTVDERLYNSVKAQMAGIHWLGNWKP